MVFISDVPTVHTSVRPSVNTGDIAAGTTIDPQRLELLELAVELEVDKEDFDFLNAAEEAVWDELSREFEARTDRLGRVWLAG